jgi:hypothetical protein
MAVFDPIYYDRPHADVPPDRPEVKLTFGAGTEDPRFHDRAWMESRYLQHGDMWIALELGCTRKTIQRQRGRMNIASLPRGPRANRRQSQVPLADDPLAATLRLVNERVTVESTPGNPRPSRQQLAANIRALAHEQDPDAIDDLLIAVASTATRLHHDRQQYQQAA